jgi:two-component system chemotaxis response regulator CheB
MPPLFTRARRALGFQIRDSSAGGRIRQKLKPGRAWIAPGDFHTTVERRGSDVHLALNQDRPENSCRPAVDVLFRSVASTFGAETLAVVLTDMGSDGVLRAQVVRQRWPRHRAGRTPQSFGGMPGQVAADGFADNIYPIGSIATEVDRQV